MYYCVFILLYKKVSILDKINIVNKKKGKNYVLIVIKN